MSISFFWLASNSPRRREMISWLGWSFRSAPSNADESIGDAESAIDYVKRVSLSKSQTPVTGANAGDVIIAADTIVVLDGRILGKPVDSQNADEMLKSLRNREHQVITAVSVRQEGSQFLAQDLCCSAVHMRDYSDEEIRDYVLSGDPMDKAGSYAIQSPEFDPVIGFSGCFASVMGMPLCHLERTLRKIADYEGCEISEICQHNIDYKCPITQLVLMGEDIG